MYSKVRYISLNVREKSFENALSESMKGGEVFQKEPVLKIPILTQRCGSNTEGLVILNPYLKRSSGSNNCASLDEIDQ